MKQAEPFVADLILISDHGPYTKNNLFQPFKALNSDMLKSLVYIKILSRKGLKFYKFDLED